MSAHILATTELNQSHIWPFCTNFEPSRYDRYDEFFFKYFLGSFMFVMHMWCVLGRRTLYLVFYINHLHGRTLISQKNPSLRSRWKLRPWRVSTFIKLRQSQGDTLFEISSSILGKTISSLNFFIFLWTVPWKVKEGTENNDLQTCSLHYHHFCSVDYYLAIPPATTKIEFPIFLSQLSAFYFLNFQYSSTPKQ